MAGTSRERPMRADAERTTQRVLEAAERVLAADPAAPLERVAEEAGVARTTVHRRFNGRDALVAALTAWATRQFHDAVTSAHPGTAPPLVALYQATANVLRVKTAWSFAMSRAVPEDPEVARLHAEVLQACDGLFRRARDAGLLRPETDLEWARQVYYGLIHQAAGTTGVVGTAEVVGEVGDDDIDARATLVVDTLLRGIGRPEGLTGS